MSPAECTASRNNVFCDALNCRLRGKTHIQSRKALLSEVDPLLSRQTAVWRSDVIREVGSHVDTGMDVRPSDGALTLGRESIHFIRI